MSTLLDVKNLGISFGGLRAVNDFDLKIQKEELYGLIGPNGAGKTTVFNLLTGVYKPDSGKVLLDGKDLTGKKNIEISKAGIARTFQNIRLFKELTVLDNVKVGLHNHHHYSTIEGILRLPNYRKVEKEMNVTMLINNEIMVIRYFFLFLLIFFRAISPSIPNIFFTIPNVLIFFLFI